MSGGWSFVHGTYATPEGCDVCRGALLPDFYENGAGEVVCSPQCAQEIDKTWAEVLDD